MCRCRRMRARCCYAWHRVALRLNIGRYRAGHKIDGTASQLDTLLAKLLTLTALLLCDAVVWVNWNVYTFTPTERHIRTHT